jgi:phosphoglycolate phosphatase
MDIETARNAGMRAIAVTWGFHDRQRLLAAGADRLVDEPIELLDANLDPTETVGTHSQAGSARPQA